MIGAFKRGRKFGSRCTERITEETARQGTSRNTEAQQIPSTAREKHIADPPRASRTVRGDIFGGLGLPV
jgi:hypothetical protein